MQSSVFFKELFLIFFFFFWRAGVIYKGKIVYLFVTKGKVALLLRLVTFCEQGQQLIVGSKIRIKASTFQNFLQQRTVTTDISNDD